MGPADPRKADGAAMRRPNASPDQPTGDLPAVPAGPAPGASGGIVHMRVICTHCGAVLQRRATMPVNDAIEVDPNHGCRSWAKTAWDYYTSLHRRP